MKKGVFKLISFVSLAIFVFVKIANAHTYFHVFEDDNAIENCQTCEYYQVQENHDFPVPATENPKIYNPYFPKQAENPVLVSFVPTRTVSGKYFNRPPPASHLG